MNWKDFINNHEEIEKFLEDLYSDHGSKIDISSSNIKIPIDLLGSKINIHKDQLSELEIGNFPNAIPNFKYLKDYGIKFKNYFEIAISITSDDYNWFEGDDWNTSPLKFKIGKTQYEINKMSSLMVLLTEPIFKDSDYYYDFDEFATIKMIIDRSDNYKKEFSKGIYYLNSHYLKSLKFYAKLKHLTLDDDDPLGLFSGEDPKEIFKKVKRVRNRKRNDFEYIEPLNLYNDALQYKGDHRFLSYYRVLEFFMTQALLETTRKLRFDNTVSDIELIKQISIRTEQDQLINLLKTITTASKKNKLIDFCFSKGLINSREFKKIAIALYKYRNSLVHAKEKEIQRTNIPDPFEATPNNQTWMYLVEEIARMSIHKLNKK